MQAQASTSMPYIDHTYGGMNGYSGGLAPLNPPAARGEHIWIQIWQYIPIYPAIIPIYALLCPLGVLGSDISGGSPRGLAIHSDPATGINPATILLMSHTIVRGQARDHHIEDELFDRYQYIVA